MDDDRRLLEKAHELLRELNTWTLEECEPIARKILKEAVSRCRGDVDVAQHNLVAALILSLEENLRYNEAAALHNARHRQENL